LNDKIKNHKNFDKKDQKKKLKKQKRNDQIEKQYILQIKIE
jgi:hypothetical protein